MICLDTSYLINVLRGDPEIEGTVESLSENNQPLAITAITYMELLEGAERYHLPEEERKQIHELISSYIFLPFGRLEAERAAQLSADLLNEGTPIGTEDVMIAATALENDADLLTENEKHFQRIPSLHLWSPS